jgi:preprotein translocase subunit SecA
LFTLYPVPADVTPETLQGKSLDEVEEIVVEAAHAAYDKKAADLGPDLMKRAERLVMLNAIDFHWRRHLTDLDVLREGIGLMAIAQRDPLVEYKREAFGMWQDLQEEISLQAIRNIFRVQANVAQPVIRRPTNIQAVRPGAVATSKPEPVRKTTKDSIGRNDLCWCGSGKKYKHCHMRTDKGLKAAE